MATSSAAATVFGILYGADGNPLIAQDLVFRPSSTKPRFFSGGLTAVGQVTATTNATGFFTTTLLPGKYFLRLSGADPVPFVVPTAGNFLLQDLIAGGSGSITAGVNYRDVGASTIQRQLLSTNGGWYVPQVVISGGASVAYGVASAFGAGANFQDRSGMFELIASSDGSFRAPYVTGTALAPVMALAAVNATPFTNKRILAGKFQLYNPSTSLYHTWFLSDTSTAFGPGES
jgi:hypothetical protein